MLARVSFDRTLTYSHLATVLVSCPAILDCFYGTAVSVLIGISMLSLPVFGAISIWLFVQAFERGDHKKLAHAIIEIALSLVQIGFLIPQFQ